jgi:cell division septation protein DedD
MRDQNRLKEKFTLSLDGRQVASVVVGSLVVLGAVFVLGFSVGRQIGLREARPAAAPADPLAALDAPSPRPDAGEPPPRLSYHEALTKDRPAEAPRPAPPRPPSAPEPQPAAAPPPAATQAQAPAAPAAQAPAPVAVAPVPAAGSEPEPAAFAIQVGASQDRAEAERIAGRYRAHRPRVLEAVVPGKGRWYRVKLGAFDSKADAERYLRDLARETGAKGFVTSGN